MESCLSQQSDPEFDLAWPSPFTLIINIRRSVILSQVLEKEPKSQEFWDKIDQLIQIRRSDIVNNKKKKVSSSGFHCSSRQLDESKKLKKRFKKMKNWINMWTLLETWKNEGTFKWEGYQSVWGTWSNSKEPSKENVGTRKRGKRRLSTPQYCLNWLEYWEESWSVSRLTVNRIPVKATHESENLHKGNGETNNSCALGTVLKSLEKRHTDLKIRGKIEIIHTRGNLLSLKPH